MYYSDLYSNTLVACILNSILAFTAVVLNVLVILALRKNPSLPRKTLKTLLLSMSVSDLGVGLVAQPLQIYILVGNINFLSQSYIDLDHYEAVFKAYRVLAKFLTFASFLASWLWVLTDFWSYAFSSGTSILWLINAPLLESFHFGCWVQSFRWFDFLSGSQRTYFSFCLLLLSSSVLSPSACSISLFF